MHLRRLTVVAALIATLGFALAPVPASAALVQIDPAYSTIKFDVTTNTVKATTADGADVTQGALADAACASDNGTCTIEAVLKRVAQRLTTLNTTLGTPMQATGGTVGLVAGTAIIGKFGIDQTTPGTTNGVVPAGNVASAATDSGNPVKVGCVYNSTQPTFTTGQRADVQCGSKGSLSAQLMVPNSGNSIGTVDYSADQINPASVGTEYVFADFPYTWTGTRLDRAFTCASSATVNVTAGSTTQIVGLSGSTVIRICSIGISMSAAGQAGVYTGTGTNCGTGTTAVIQDMTLPTGTPFALSAPSGGSLVRSSAGGEICVKAVTGNVTGFISYTQY